MTDTTKPSGVVKGSRWVLAALTLLFLLGAFGQFFLVGLSYFDDPSRWKDHENLGHILGMLPWAIWIPAVLGKAGRGVIIASVLLFVAFEAQYAFIEAGDGFVHAFHPLNGAVLLILGGWLFQQAFGLLRKPASATSPEGTA
ncbi:MAG TPA: DUF6220 domain-containing protein [Thermomicrobiales bacterium]|nr:DUF6220 domain-containing protein [Thermomicrobiales bacterium]